MTLDRPASEYPKQRSPYEHFREAEGYLSRAESRFEQSETINGSRSLERLANRDLAFAQVHATLATVRPA